MAKRIEPGCMAVVEGHPHLPINGLVFRVKGRMGKVSTFIGIRWEVDGIIPDFNINTGLNGKSINHIREDFLKRIDEDDENHRNTVTTWDDENNVWSPQHTKEDVCTQR